MATLDEVIKQRLADAAKIDEATKVAAIKTEADPETVGKADEVDTKPTVKKELTKEDVIEVPLVEDKKEVAEVNEPATVSSQVASLLEAEGLSEEFKTQAVTIFEAAVTDRVLQLEEGLKTKFDTQLAEAIAELDNDIDGFLSEAIQQWKQENEVAIESNFKSQLAESFMDGLQTLLGKHNIEVPEGKENALEIALEEVDSLTESVTTKDTEMAALVEQVNTLKAEKILESFKEKMTQTEFDRFVQLTESVKYKDETQYETQLNVVLENFGNTKSESAKPEQVLEAVLDTTVKVVTENTDMAAYANYLSKKR